MLHGGSHWLYAGAPNAAVGKRQMLSQCSLSKLTYGTLFQAKYYQHAPSILFATFALVSGFLTLGFPETADKVLPTTMEDARDLDAARQVRLDESSDDQEAPRKMC